MNTLYFIGGASGSGKTAVMPYLREILGEGIAIHDFDDIGVPEGADQKWRQESTEKWLQKLLSDNKDACLLGQMVLGEILSCPSALQIEKINFCLLDVSDFKRIQRLTKRNTYGADQNMLNWSAWLRMHHQDPQWTPHVIQENCADVMDFSQLNQLKNWDKAANVNVIDTTDSTLNEVTQKIAEWVEDVKISKDVLFIPNTSYTIHFNEFNSYNIIDKKVIKFDKLCVPATQKSDIIDKNFIIKDGNEVIAGICADIYIWKILYISLLFVEGNYRHQGLGTLLLNKVEEEAKKFGVKLAHLDTFDFQAKDFYCRHGYEVFGTLDNCPEGQKRYYMKKIL